MRDSIVKVIKVPFSNSKPDEGFTLHATSEYVIGGEKEKKEEIKEKVEEFKEKGEEVKKEVVKVEEVKKENDKGKGNKNNQKAAGKENKKKQEVKIEKEEKTEPAENIIISIYKK
jgi:hypothetical protein